MCVILQVNTDFLINQLKKAFNTRYLACLFYYRKNLEKLSIAEVLRKIFLNKFSQILKAHEERNI